MEVMSVAAAYDAFMGRWSKVVAHRFVAWLSVPPHRRWLDIGCGTGALAEAILASAAPDEVWGVDPSEEFVAHVRAALPAHQERFLVADGQSLPQSFADFDATVSGLALNQIPAPRAGLSEMMRVTRPGGIVAAYVWDFAEGMQMLRYFWDVTAGLDPGSSGLDLAKEYPLCRADRLLELFQGAGLDAVEVRPLEVPTVFRNFDDYWSPLLNGYGRPGAYVMSLSEEHRSTLRERLRAALPAGADGAICLMARAWAIRGRIPDK